jgi:hypothetical protein
VERAPRDPYAGRRRAGARDATQERAVSKGIAVLGALSVVVLAVALWRRASAPDLAAASATEAESVQFLDGADPASASTSADLAAAHPVCTTTLRARVVDARGRPIPRARVAIDFPPAAGETAGDGTVEIALELVRRGGPRPVHLRVSAAGRARLALSIDLEEDAVVDAGDLVLAPGATLRGRVLDDRGGPFAGASVRASDDLELYRAWKLHGPTRSSAEATSGPDGRFVLEGLPLGPVRVWAGSDETFWSASDAVEAGGARGEEVVLRLQRIPPENVIEVRVVAPDGAPLAGAAIEIRATAKGSTVELDGIAGEDGRYRHVATLRGPHEVRARDPLRRFRDATASEVQPGGPPVVLALGEARPLRIVVTDPAGAPIETFHARLLARDGAELAAAAGGPHAGGVATLPLPSQAFYVDVRAEGWTIPEPAREIDPEGADGEIAVVLAPRIALRGVVRASGEPLAGAVVELLRGDGARRQGVRTGASGEFVLASDVEERVAIRVEAEGFASAVLGPLEGGVALDGLEVELVRGGSVQGLLLVDPGESAEGRTVVASRGDGRDLATRTDTDGRFVFEHLTPGPWTISADGATREASLEARDGETATAEVSCRTLPAVRLSGRLSFAGATTAGLRARLLSGGREVCVAEIDSFGGFELVSPRAGEHVIRVESSGANEDLRIEASALLRDGDNSWDLDLPLGRAQGRLVHGVAGGATFGWRWTDGASLSASGTLRADAEGTFVVPRMPAGTITFVRRIGSAEESLGEIDLPERATIDVEL